MQIIEIWLLGPSTRLIHIFQCFNSTECPARYTLRLIGIFQGLTAAPPARRPNLDYSPQERLLRRRQERLLRIIIIDHTTLQRNGIFPCGPQSRQ